MVRHRAMRRHDEPGGVLLRVCVRGAASRGGRHAQLASEAPAFAQRHANHLSVRNVVPTLTSSKRQGLSLDGRC
jgi:hypothetical protein